MTWRALSARPYRQLELRGEAKCRPRPLGVAAQVELKAKFESKIITFQFQALISWRFQRRFHRVNLHRPTSRGSAACAPSSAAAKAPSSARSNGVAAASNIGRAKPGSEAAKKHESPVPAAPLNQGLTLVHFSA